MFKYFIKGVYVNTTFMFTEEIATFVNTDISSAVGFIRLDGQVVKTNLKYSLISANLDELLKDGSIKEVDFFQVYEMLKEEYRERFIKNMYDLYNINRNVAKEVYYIGEVIREDSAANYDKAAERGSCVKYLYVEVDTESKNMIQLKVKGAFRVALKAIDETELYLSNCHIPIALENRRSKSLQTPVEFGSLQEAKQAIINTRKIVKFAFNIPMIFSKNSDGTFKLVKFSM